MKNTGDLVFDAIVVGGGPAGSSCAGLLAKKGWRVLLLEKAKFPRYHIGESILTGTVKTLEELDLLDRIDKIGGSIRKYGGTLRWGVGKETWNFVFKEASPYEYSFQVRRADFDALLLTRARELGVTVIEEAAVSKPLLDGDRVTGVTYTLRNAQQTYDVHARFVVDASGQSAAFGRHFGAVQWNEDFRNMATWAYFQDCERYEGTRVGDNVTEHTEKGWFWCIPLSDGTNSIGFVSPMGTAGKSRQEMEDFFFAELDKTEEVKRLLRNAQRVSEFRSAKDWSYTCDRMHGSGWAATGDAAAFVDPLISTGVTLALRSARGLAEAVDSALTDPESEAESLKRYEENYRLVIDQVLAYVRFFYDKNRSQEEYWEKAQQIVDPDGFRPRMQDFVTVMSGLNTMFATTDEFELYASLKAADERTQALG
ncbi:NAD(P)/FAD-dependent oxidoreductase [Nocardia sp. CC201C]|uniref:NAD(P)/FAD-dependent oxidoreductase n=1 Tax=Nocardia sp. CC201C TaxID=3044575 RepID=UPI0024A9C363|nr:NAD(P)/FAD-dependent oxidoreductase [Nocardia sp. CC201C]